jgi:hypothetical protein
MKVIIAGGREFNDYDLLKTKCDSILSEVNEPIAIVSGKANGADSLGERYAKEKGYFVIPFPPDYKKYSPKVAPVMRNEEMAKIADCLIAFWNGKSRGTNDMITRAKAHSLKIRIVKY